MKLQSQVYSVPGDGQVYLVNECIKSEHAASCKKCYLNVYDALIRVESA